MTSVLVDLSIDDINRLGEKFKPLDINVCYQKSIIMFINNGGFDRFECKPGAVITYDIRTKTFYNDLDKDPAIQFIVRKIR